MNTLMYMHRLTAKQLAIARHELGYEVVGPISKLLACGDLGECSERNAEAGAQLRDSVLIGSLDAGQGAMEEWSDIVALVVKRFGLVPEQATS